LLEPKSISYYWIIVTSQLVALTTGKYIRGKYINKDLFMKKYLLLVTKEKQPPCYKPEE